MTYKLTYTKGDWYAQEAEIMSIFYPMRTSKRKNRGEISFLARILPGPSQLNRDTLMKNQKTRSFLSGTIYKVKLIENQ
jgi:hypothetical protein